MGSRHHSRADDYSRGRVRSASYKDITPLETSTHWQVLGTSIARFNSEAVGERGNMSAHKVHDIYCKDQIVSQTSKPSLPLRSNDIKIWRWKCQPCVTALSNKLSPQGETVSKSRWRAKISPKVDMRKIKVLKSVLKTRAPHDAS